MLTINYVRRAVGVLSALGTPRSLAVHHVTIGRKAGPLTTRWPTEVFQTGARLDACVTTADVLVLGHSTRFR